MRDYTFNSSSCERRESCERWESLLADALDGLLPTDDEGAYYAHLAGCPTCAALHEEARQGRGWLKFLSPEPDVPAALLGKILARTGPAQVAAGALEASSGGGVPIPPDNVLAWIPALVPAGRRPGFIGSLRRFAEPRLLTTAAMAFFSLTLTLNLTGVRLGSLQRSNLRPSAVRSYMERQLTTASTPLIRYYDHSRLVYEVESTVRDLRRTTQGEAQGQGEARGEGEENRRNQQNPVHSSDSGEAFHERSTAWTALITMV
jgi:hypothetical protein